MNKDSHIGSDLLEPWKLLILYFHFTDEEQGPLETCTISFAHISAKY